MEFNEWWSRQPKDPTKPITPKMVWDAATLIEREKCKIDCRSVQNSYRGMVKPFHIVAGECIEAIENRSQ